MAMYFVHALLGLVTDGGDFVSLNILGHYFGGDLSFVDGRRTNFGCFTIDNQQRVKADALTCVFEKLNGNSLAFSDDVLFATGLDNCFFHLDLALLEYL